MKFAPASVVTRVLLLLAIALVSGCAAAPVQEMSDARQAVRAAEQAGAPEYSPEVLAEARSLLEQAQKQLEAGDFANARDSALSAKLRALEAREQALESKTGP